MLKKIPYITFIALFLFACDDDSFDWAADAGVEDALLESDKGLSTSPEIANPTESIIREGCDGPDHDPNTRCDGNGGGGSGGGGAGGGGGSGGGGAGGGGGSINRCGVNHNLPCTGCGWFGSSPCTGTCLSPMVWYPYAQSCGYPPGTICRQSVDVTCEISYYGYCERCYFN